MISLETSTVQLSKFGWMTLPSGPDSTGDEGSAEALRLWNCLYPDWECCRQLLECKGIIPSDNLLSLSLRGG